MDVLDQLSPLLSLLIQPCAQGCCVSQMEKDFYDTCTLMGFPHTRFSVITDRPMPDTRSQRPATAPMDSLLFSINFDSFPAGFVGQYVKGQYWQFDTLLQLVQTKMHSTFFTCWHQTGQYGGAHSQHPRIDELAKQFALNSGVLLGYWNGSRQLIISLGSHEYPAALEYRVHDELLQQRILSLALTLNALIDKISQCNDCVIRARKPKVPNVSLTRMQRTMLLAYLNDPNASLTSISESHGISGDTVKYHLKRIREKLDMPGASGHVLAHEARHVSLL